MGGATEQHRPGSNNDATTTAETDSADINGDDTTITVVEIDNQTNSNKQRLSKSKYKKLITKMNKIQLTSVFNYSSVVLSEQMNEVLNLGLNFAILPLKLDITQVLVDFRKYERSMIWKEFWFNQEEETESYTPPIFKEEKTNLPKNHKTPEGLKIMLGAVRSEIVDPRNRNKVERNIPKELLDALTELIKLQRMRQIIIKKM